MQINNGAVSVVVTPWYYMYGFHFEWRINGEIIQDENDAIFLLPLTIRDSDKVEVVVSSDCGANEPRLIYLFRPIPRPLFIF